MQVELSRLIRDIVIGDSWQEIISLISILGIFKAREDPYPVTLFLLFPLFLIFLACLLLIISSSALASNPSGVTFTTD